MGEGPPLPTLSCVKGRQLSLPWNPPSSEHGKCTAEEKFKWSPPNAHCILAFCSLTCRIALTAGLLCVERCKGGWFQEVEPGSERWKAALKFVAREEGETQAGTPQPTSWACYPDRASVEELASYLNSTGGIPH